MNKSRLRSAGKPGRGTVGLALAAIELVRALGLPRTLRTAVAIAVILTMAGRASAADTTAPTFTNFTASPPIARAGTKVTVQFGASEALKRNPTLMVGNQWARFLSVSGQSYVYTVTINSNAGEGRPRVLAQGVDLAGNVGSSSAAPLITDFTPPTFTNFVATPAAAKIGTPTVLAFSASEPLGKTPTLMVGKQAATLVSVVGVNYTFAVTIDSTAGEGSPNVVAKGADGAGNIGSTSAKPLVTDFRAPRFSNFTTTPARAKIGTTVTLNFVASEPLATAPTVTVGNQIATYTSLSGSTYTYTVVINANAGEGKPTVVARGVDPSGNVGSSSGNPLVTDFTLPGFAGFSANPARVKAGATVTLRFCSTEQLAGPPTVRVGNQAATLVSESGLNYTYGLQVNSSVGEGSPDVIVRGSDLAGNTGTTIANPLTTDFTPPSFTGFTATPALATIGTRVSLSFSSSEPLRTAPSVKLGNHAATFVSVSGLAYTYMLRVARNAGEGNPTLVVEGTDLVGNVGTTTSRPLVTDFTRPSFRDLAATPAIARIGTNVTLTLTASEPLSGAPTVTVGRQAATFVSSSGLNFTYAVTIDSSAGAGNPRVVVNGSDLAGNVGALIATPLVTDFKAPRFRGFLATPSRATIGTVVSLRFIASEPLAALPEVKVGNQAATYVSVSGQVYTFVIAIDATAGEGRPTVVVQG